MAWGDVEERKTGHGRWLPAGKGVFWLKMMILERYDTKLDVMRQMSEISLEVTATWEIFQT